MGETGLNYHLIPIAGRTKTGMKNRYCMDAFSGMLKDTGESKGWAFKKDNGIKMRQAVLQNDVYALMDKV